MSPLVIPRETVKFSSNKNTTKANPARLNTISRAKYELELQVPHLLDPNKRLSPLAHSPHNIQDLFKAHWISGLVILIQTYNPIKMDVT